MAKILVIEDDPGIRELIKMILEERGHKVSTAVDGRKGVAVFNKKKPDLVITDIIMPEMDGMEVCLEILNQFPQAKIIAMSSGGRRLDAQYTLEMAREFGVRRTITKPFSPQEMIMAVDEVLAEPIVHPIKR